MNNILRANMTREAFQDNDNFELKKRIKDILHENGELGLKTVKAFGYQFYIMEDRFSTIDLIDPVRTVFKTEYNYYDGKSYFL